MRQVPKNVNPNDLNTKQYIVSSAQNDRDTQMSWNEILAINPNLLATIVPAEQLLSLYAQKYIYTASNIVGPNCLDTSMAVIFPNWNNSRFMDTPEFVCHLKKSFKSIIKPEEIGDLIVLSNDGQGIQHAFTYLGFYRISGVNRQ